MLYTAALLSAAMLLAGCYSTDTDDDLLSTATLISIYPSTVSVGSAAATQNVVVTLAPKSKRNLDWSCSVQSAWVTAVREKVPGESTGTVYEDAVVLAFLENTAYKRQTTLTITASDGTAHTATFYSEPTTLTYEQSGKSFSCQIMNQGLEFPVAGTPMQGWSDYSDFDKYVQNPQRFIVKMKKRQQ